MKAFVDLELAKLFHGHIGPNLVIGIKMGNRALAELSPQSCFQLDAEVHCPARPPVSCIIDGVQMSTGCTMGKRNIKHVVSEDEVKVVFANTATGKSITLRLKDGVIERTVGWLKQYGEEEASLMIWRAGDDEVFTVCSG